MDLFFKLPLAIDCMKKFLDDKVEDAMQFFIEKVCFLLFQLLLRFIPEALCYRRPFFPHLKTADRDLLACMSPAGSLSTAPFPYENGVKPIHCCFAFTLLCYINKVIRSRKLIRILFNSVHPENRYI